MNRLRPLAESQILSIDQAGCFDGGNRLGKYCRSGGNAATGPGSSTGDRSGTWEAKAPGGSFRLTFADGNKVRMTMQDDGGNPESHDGSYSTGAFGGLTMTFTRP